MEKRKKREGPLPPKTLFSGFLFICAVLSACLRHGPSSLRPRLTQVGPHFPLLLSGDMHNGFLGKTCRGGEERREARRGGKRGDGSNHSVPSFSQAGPTLLGHGVNRTGKVLENLTYRLNHRQSLQTSKLAQPACPSLLSELP